MGRRPRSCFQIIACGCDSKDGDEIDVLQSKNSKDKRGWSFRKRSSQHRVLNNTVIAEISPVEKGNLETATIDFQSSANSTVPEKPTIIHFTNEEAHVPNIENPKESDKVDDASENGSKVDSEVEETTVIVIQAGIRGILAQRELLKHKNVVKVQAAVRGFLVRRHAVGTLRCAQAIVKMQAIVRARRAHLSIERSAHDELYKKSEKKNSDSNIAVKGGMAKSNIRYISLEKLLTNSFARQLLESTPRNKPINIKCVPSKNDSAWKWLERWLAVTSLDVLEPEKEVSVPDQMERETEEPEKDVSKTSLDGLEPEKDVSVTEKMEREVEEPGKEVSVTEQMVRETEELEKEVSVAEQMERETEELGKEVSVLEQMERETEELEKEVSVTEQMERKPEELEKEISSTEQIERETEESEEEVSITAQMEIEIEEREVEVSVPKQMEREIEELEKEVSVTEQMERKPEELEKEISVTEQMERETMEPDKEVLVTEQIERETKEPEKEVLITEQMVREIKELEKEVPVTEKMVKEIEESHFEDKVESIALSETEDLNSNTVKSVWPSVSEDLITYDTCFSPSLSVNDNLEQPQPENARSSEVKETSTNVNSVQDQKIQLDDADLQTESSSPSDKPQMDMELVCPLKRLAPKQLENEGKKFVLGSRKVSNPSFINAQAKFEQLSLAPGSIGTISSIHQDDGIKLHSESISSKTDMVPRMKEPSADENIILPGSRIIQVGDSEYGTELSISSTLVSPDRFEAGLVDTHANDISKKEVHDLSGDLSTKVVVKSSSTTIQIDVQLLVDQPEESNKSNGLFVTSVSVVDSSPRESKLESSSYQQREHDMGLDHQTYRSSPEASPRSHLTVPESQGTPSSQVSVKAKREKINRTVSYQKQKSSSVEKKSSSSLNRNFATRSTENSYRDQKTGKRNSLDSARQENVEKELRESSSSNSLPRFMQATQSARAKLHSTTSPSSSPDVQDREIYIKKRHSFPAEGWQGSPRVQQGAKGNEKTWRR